MDAAVARLVRAVRDGETIVVFGDYDVDGATSAALLLRFFAAIGARASVYVPDRHARGLRPERAGAAAPAGTRARRSSVTVDCGATAHEPLAAAAEAGLDVIVVDHHVGRAAAAAGRRGRQSEPARRDQPARRAGRGRGRLPAGRRGQPGAARGRLVRRAAPSPTCCNGSTWWRSARCATSSR